jgi:alkanesulfonate monooxygenase SsuD/methylene tetrahydromethanopterin reductase-like flavin-dependent oxidoreductase (luciferase family)
MVAMTGDRSGTRTAIALRDALPWDDVVEIVQTAEQTGYETLFLPEVGARETFSTLAALAGRTSTIGLATGVVTTVARRQSVTAMAAATVHDLSGGRMVLGLGTGPSDPGALDRLRRYLGDVRELFEGGSIDEERRGERVRLGIAVEPPLPVWIAALGPRAVALGGAIADGVILNWCTPERVAQARASIDEAARAAGRDPHDVTVAVYVRAVIGQEPQHALPGLRAMAAQYASYPAYARQFAATGLGDDARAAAAALQSGRLDAVPERLIRSVAVVGDADEAARRLDSYRAAGADVVVVYPVAVLDPASSILATVFGLAPRPAVEA